MSDTMKRDAVLVEFPHQSIALSLPRLHRLADEIVRLRERLVDVEAERDDIIAICRGTQMDDATIHSMRGYVTEKLRIEAERDALRTRAEVAEAQRDLLKGYYRDAVKVGTECAEKMRRAERILALLREPSDAVLKAVEMHYGNLRDLLIVAVAAAEQEVDV